MGFFFKSKPKKKPDHWEVVCTFTQGQTLMLCQCQDAFGKAPKGSDNTAKHLLWSQIAEFYPEYQKEEHYRLNMDNALCWKLYHLIKGDG